MTYSIEPGLPIPKSQRGGWATGRPRSPLTQALLNLQPGDSVLVQDKSLANVVARVGQVKKQCGNTRNFTVRKTDAGPRVWRIV